MIGRGTSPLGSPRLEHPDVAAYQAWEKIIPELKQNPLAAAKRIQALIDSEETDAPATLADMMERGMKRPETTIALINGTGCVGSQGNLSDVRWRWWCR
jgi:hypothetical protein